MPISYVGVGTAATSSGGATGSVTPALPSGLQVNDLMIIIVTGRGNHSFATPTGWTQKFQEQLYPTDNLHKLAIFYRFYQSGDGNPTVSWTGGGTNQTVIAQVFAFRGVDSSDPIPDLGPNSGNASAQNIGPITGFTPTNAGNDGCVIVVGHKADDWTSVATLSGDGLTWNEIAEPDTTSGNDAGQVYDYALYSGSPPTITNKTFTVTGGAANTGAGKMFSLKKGVTTTTRTISGQAVLKTTTTRTIDGVARLKTTTSQTVSGYAYLKGPVTKTITGLATLKTTTVRTVSGSATLKTTKTKTIDGYSVLKTTTIRTISGEAIAKTTTSRTLDGYGILKTATSRTISGYAYLKEAATTTRTISCLLYTSPSPRDRTRSRMPSSA